MVISKTPYRISFFGGGTDFPDWFREHGGAVISTSIDKYCYISIRVLPPFFDHKFRIVYSDIELIKKIDEINHPSVRECLKLLNVSEGLEIHYDGDLPSRSGLGSSSAFTVGLINAIKAHQGRMVPKRTLSDLAITIDREMVQEAGGIQDQIASAYGGFNHITFKENDYDVNPVVLTPRIRKELEDGLCLFFTGKTRLAETIEREKISQIREASKYYRALKEQTDEALKLLASRNFVMKDFGALLKEGWNTKKLLANGITNGPLDELMEKASQAGAYGGKVLGAGGGGFVLFATEPYLKHRLIEALYPLTYVPFKFDFEGSKIALYNP